MTTNLPQEQEQQEQTLMYFNGYFDQPVRITANEQDLIVSYFFKITNDEEAAKSLASAVITIADQNNVAPMEVLDEIRSNDGLTATKNVALLLNSTRRNTSLVGYKQARSSNPKVSRNILA